MRDPARRKFIIIVLFALFLRLLSLYFFRNIDNYDLQSYRIVGILTKNHINIYPSPADLRHPYLPFYMYLEALFSPLFLKFINTIFDLGILYLVYLVSKKDLKTAFLYAVNPVTILIFTLHGQFDSLPIFFLLLSFRLASKGKDAFAVLSFSLSILVKTWPLIFILMLLKNLRKKHLILFTAIFPILGILIYSHYFNSTPLNIINTIIHYQGLQGIWGFGYLFRRKVFTYIFLILLFICSYFIKANSLINKSYRFLSFFFFTTL